MLKYKILLKPLFLQSNTNNRLCNWPIYGWSSRHILLNLLVRVHYWKRK